MAAGVRSSSCKNTRINQPHECMNIKWNDYDRGTLHAEDFIIINVSGMKYETLRSTLDRFPNTLLGNNDKRSPYFNRSKNAYFFNRCRQSFEAVLYYYQSGGILTRPPSIPLHVFEKEIRFYSLEEDVTSKRFNEDEFIITDFATKKVSSLPKLTPREKLWNLFEHPDSSWGARVVSFLSMFVIGVSITIFCMETLPVFRKQIPKTVANITNRTSPSNQQDEHALMGYLGFCFAAVEMCCVVWFTLEYVIRFLSSPSKSKFLLSLLNAIDLVAILPYFVGMWISNGGNATPLSVLRVVRLVRVFRIFKLSRHSLSLQILGDTLRASVREMAMLVFFLAVGVLVFSSALYYADYAEAGPDGQFRSIPDTFWYTLVTMTTIGYGDIVPKTLIGKLIGSLCTITGVLTLALPVPVIVSNFQYFYKKHRGFSGRK